jgi:Bacterial Ig-like domain (group 2)
MRVPPMPQVCSGLLCGLLILITGCSNPSSQTLDSLTVTATPSSVPIGGAAVLKAVAHLSDGTTQDVTASTQWTLSNTALATISNSTLTAKVSGTVTVQAAYVEATPAGSSPSAATASPQNLSASTQVTITTPGGPGGGTTIVPTITWNAPAAISYGTALGSTQLNATANVAGTFAYTPAAGTVLKAGNQTLSATFTPSDSKTYSAATASVQLTVNQAAPTITWATPAPIVAGTALSATQLDATASVPGSFMYNPAAGAVLAAGTQQLTAVFLPTDTTDYSSTTAHASLTITSPSNPPPNPGTPNANVCQTLPPNPSQTTLQNAINSCGNGNTLQLSAGVTTITSSLNLACGVIVSGPVVPLVNGLTTPTAEITTSNNIELFKLSGGCTTGATTGLEYLRLDGFQSLEVDGNNYSNIVISYNTLTTLASNSSNDYPAVSFNQGNGNTVSNVTFEHNTVGDSNSCTWIETGSEAAGTVIDDDGCGFEVFAESSAASAAVNFTIRYNYFYHLGEAIHFFGTSYIGSGATNYCTGCDIEYNYFNNIHRISIEFQPEVGNGAAPIFSNNVFSNPANGYYETYTLSLACCQWGTTQAVTTTENPSVYAQNNVIYSTVSPGYTWGFEAWGYGAPYNNNMLQGYVCAGVVWAYITDTTSISDNIMQGPIMASGSSCPNYTPLNGTFIGIDGSNTTAGTSPTVTGNVTGATPSSVTSVAPTISPASGSQTFPLTVTLTDRGYTSGSQPLGNTGIWYTTDGSTPVPGASCTAPCGYLPTGGTFTLASAATVKAVGMWGTPPQPTSYPAGYGFVPSGVVTAAYSAGAAVKKPAATAKSSNSPTEKLTPAVAAAAELPVAAASAVLESIAISPTQPVVPIGSTTQLKAIATFGDGSVKDVTADFAWQSSDVRTMRANGSGTLAGVASGKAIISGSYRGLQASVSANSTIGELVWSDPIVITEGGTYSGNWQSTDAKTPAVTVATTAPVIIENAHLRSVGGLIKTSVAGTDLTVRNSVGVAVSAAVKGQPNGVFAEVASPARLDVENNYIENAQGGIIVHGYAGNRDGGQTIVIRSNRARNMNGLLSDGNGGYLPGEGANRSQARFIQFDRVQSVPGIDVGWNEVINYPGRSLVEDNIDIYGSGGTPNRPLEIHDTYIQGAYPYKAAQDAYDGGGIKTDAEAGDNAQEVPAFNSIHDNQVVGTTNYGIQFAAGHDNVAANNRVISSGLLADGTKIAAQNVGMANSDATGSAVANGSMYNNTMHDNLIGWACWNSSCPQSGYRKDQSFPASPADYSTNSVLAPQPITPEMENNEYQIWLNKTVSAGIAVGPIF